MAKKRGIHEGSFTKLPSGSIRVQITVNGSRKSFTASTKKECPEWCREANKQADPGLSSLFAQTTLKDYLDDWLIILKSSLRQSTWIKYEQVTRCYILPRLGKIKVRELRPDQIQALYGALIKEKVGIPTVAKTHTVLHSALERAVKLGIAARNSAGFVEVPKEATREMTIFDEAQVSSFCIAIMGHRLESLYNLALATGARQMELLGLKWTDLDWNRRTLKIERQLVRPDGEGVKFNSPKTKFGRRTVDLGTNSIELLRKHFKRQQIERQKAGEEWREYGLIFPTSVGTPILQRNLLRSFRIILKDTGLPRIRFYDLRHTAASLMLNSNIPLLVVSRRLGHARASITLDVYGHLIPSMQSEAAGLMDGLLTPIAVEPMIHAIL